MSIADEVGAAITDAMRRKDAPRLSALRMLKAAFMNREVEKGRALDDGEARQVVQSLVKQRRDSIEQFQKGGRQDLVDKETAEIGILESYLPPAADPAIVDAAVTAAIAETGSFARSCPAPSAWRRTQLQTHPHTIRRQSGLPGPLASPGPRH